jgi:hypothetical protein
MAEVPKQWSGKECPHGYPLEFETQCPECKTKEKPAVEVSGVRPKINLTEEEINELVSRIDAGQIETGELIKFKAPATEGEVPVAVMEEEKEESNLDRLKREAEETAQELIDTLMAKKNIIKKIEQGKETLNGYLTMFTNKKAEMIGRRFLGAAMTELAMGLGETNEAEIISAMQTLGLRATKYRERKEYQG